MIQITLTDTGVNAALSRLLGGLQNPQPTLKSIGELVMEFTKTRFAVSQGPYGTPWAPNQDSTLRALLHRHSRSFTRTGQVSAKGQQRLANKKPLIGESKSLSKQFSYRLVSHGVEVYSTLIYAAMHQFGINPRVREGDRYSSTGKTNGPRFHRDDVAGGPRAGRLPALY
jgi:phage gpG-like protein